MVVVNNEIKCPSDHDPFPFGKYKGYAYQRVPAKYLDWLRDQDLSKHPQVALYIEKNGKVIDLELRGK